MASTLARSTPRLTRPFSMLEIVVCGMPHKSDSWDCVSPCSSRMIARGDLYSLLGRAEIAHLLAPIIVRRDSNNLNEKGIGNDLVKDSPLVV